MTRPPIRRHTGRGAGVALATGLTLAAVAASAFAATGALTPQDCVDDNDTGAEACAQAQDGLQGAIAAAVSPDGTSVYAVSVSDDAIVRFSRDTGTGELTPLDCYDDDDSGTEASCVGAGALDNPNAVTISPDGKSVYVASSQDDAVARFDRDAATGALTERDCVEDNDTGEGECSQTADGLNGANSVAVSPDGKSVYAASNQDDAVARFNRDNADDGGDPDDLGELTPQGCVEDDDPPDGPDGCAQDTDGLEFPEYVVVSPNGKSVYAASFADDAVVHMSRDTNDGALAAADGDCVDDNDTGDDACTGTASGLDGVQGLAASADGRSIYAAGASDDAVVHLSRNTTTGVLSPQGCVEDNDTGEGECTQATDGLDGVNAVEASLDGKSVYATGSLDDAVVRLKRTSGTGVLAPRGCVDDNDAGTGEDTCGQSADALGGVNFVAASPNGGSVYATGFLDDAVVRFDREIDTTAPAVGVSSGPTGSTEDTTPSFGFTSEAGSTAQCRFDSAAFGACSGPGKSHTPASPLAEGSHTFQVRATDDSENSAVASRSFDVNTPPETTIDSAPKDKLKTKRKKAKAVYEFSADESGAAFECSLDGDPFEPCSSPHKEKVKKGKHTFEVRATDAVGNVDPTPAEDSFKVKRKGRKG